MAAEKPPLVHEEPGDLGQRGPRPSAVVCTGEQGEARGAQHVVGPWPPVRLEDATEDATEDADEVVDGELGVVAFCGLRLGELMGLRRADLDLLHRRVYVRRQLQEFGSGVEATAPKTDAGIRRVSIPARIVPDLESHLAQWAQPGVEGGVFPGPNGAFRRLTVYKAWHRALAEAGVAPDVHIHDLRHFANVMAASVPGVSTKDLMARMGHASVAAAIRYQHATEGAEPAISAGIDAAIEVVRRDDANEGRADAAAG